ncbi:hypothetical protein DIS24_g9024 [Lasiodiplodia hormozganensis]|uniref:DUF6594 domain-containing protein n=1 Tax=Lasiodiplodia hormozganensis TaxID=869390 RepID=A0AA40CKM8_9PEZI|nr:hypothetical protein DIS24_g9024 [Lasiodiplodia hormozganensis]
MKLQNKIQRKLHEYHEALLLQAWIARLDRPGPRVLSALRNWFTGAYLGMSGGETLPIVGGKVEHLFEDENDLMTLKTPPDQDLLSKTLRSHWRPLGKRQQGSADGAEYYLERHVARLVAVISSVAAAMLLIGAVVALHFITKAGVRLGMIACFTILFVFSLGLLTNAKRAEIFAATAAYAAVLVVFVSGD